MLRDLVWECEMAIEMAVDSDLHHPGNCSDSVEECLSQCTMVNCARHFVWRVYSKLEEDDSEGVVGNMRDLIIGGIAKAKYPGNYRGDDMPLGMRFPLNFCSCGAVDAYFDDH